MQYLSPDCGLLMTRAQSSVRWEEARKRNAESTGCARKCNAKSTKLSGITQRQVRLLRQDEIRDTLEVEKKLLRFPWV